MEKTIYPFLMSAMLLLAGMAGFSSCTAENNNSNSDTPVVVTKNDIQGSWSAKGLGSGENKMLVESEQITLESEYYRSIGTYTVENGVLTITELQAWEREGFGELLRASRKSMRKAVRSFSGTKDPDSITDPDPVNPDEDPKSEPRAGVIIAAVAGAAAIGAAVLAVVFRKPKQ